MRGLAVEGGLESTRIGSRVSREVWWLFSVYIALLILLPAGSILGVNVKMLTFVPLMGVVGFLFLRDEESKAGGGLLLKLGWMLGLVAAFLGWAIRSQVNGAESGTFDALMAVSQLKDVLSTLAGCWFVRLLTRNEADRRSFVRLVLYMTAFGAVLKGLIFLYCLKTGISVSQFMEGVSKLFGVELMSVDMGEVSVRLQFVSDNLLPVCVFAVLCLRRKLGMGALVSMVVLGLLLMSSMYTFSRYLWASTGLAVVLGMVVSKRDWMHWLYLGAAGGVVAYFYPVIAALVAFRFSSQLTGYSDDVRVEQIRLLKEFFWEAPFLGHGLGSYVTQIIRSVETPYAYEVQLLALAGQVGLVGLTLFAGLLVNYYRKAFRFERGGRMYQLAVLAMLGSFIAAGLFNPCLLSSTAAVIFGFIFALAALEDCGVEAMAEEARPVLFAWMPIRAAGASLGS